MCNTVHVEAEEPGNKVTKCLISQCPLCGGVYCVTSSACVPRVVLQRRIGVTEDSDSSSEDVMDGEEVQFEAQDSDSDDEGGGGRRVK